jgi:thiamine biosynthesis lipoprotein
VNRREALKLFGLALVDLSFADGRALAALAAGPNPEAEIVRGARVMMGNVRVTISVVASDRAEAREAIAAAFAEMRRIESLLSVFDPGSEFSRINAASGDRPVAVGPETFEVIRRGQEVARLTGGAFDMALGPAIRSWDFLGTGHVPSAEEVAKLGPLCRSEFIRTDPAGREVFLKKRGMAIDPGGLGKGYMAERAKRVLRDRGISSGIIAASGDLVLFGKRPDGEPWRIAVRHPRHRDATIASIDLTDCAVSTSGDYERFFTKEGVSYHHLLDPATIFPARECQSVTVINDEGIAADAIATGAFVMGPEQGLALLDRPEAGSGIVIDRGGTVRMTPSLVGRVRLE